jgi:hypothetical protein
MDKELAAAPRAGLERRRQVKSMLQQHIDAKMGDALAARARVAAACGSCLGEVARGALVQVIRGDAGSSIVDRDRFRRCGGMAQRIRGVAACGSRRCRARKALLLGLPAPLSRRRRGGQPRILAENPPPRE